MVKKSFETRLRRMAERRGFVLQKSRARDPGSFFHGGYKITTIHNTTAWFSVAARRGMASTQR